MSKTITLLPIARLFGLVAILCVGCKKDESTARVDTTTTAAPAAPAPAENPRVRGTVQSITKDTLVVTTSTGPVSIAITSPLQVYKRAPSDLAHVNEHSFVGVTSVKQPDGTQKATEIHIFPEALRGTGEGSNLMQQTGAGGAPSTMTNGTVAAPRNDSGPRMTNGTVSAKANPSSLTVQYKGGAQTIVVPADVSVTELAETKEPLTPGLTIFVLAKKQSDGTLAANQVIVSTTPAGAPKR